MTFLDVTAGDFDDIGVRVCRELTDAEVNVIDTTVDAPGDVCISIKADETTAELHFDAETAGAIADQIEKIQRDPTDGFPIGADFDASAETVE